MLRVFAKRAAMMSMAPRYAMASQKSIYDMLGGESAMDHAVARFYVRVLSDPLVNHFFKDTDMIKQMEHQKRFLTTALGGPNKYTGRSMKAAHAKFALTDKHFDRIGAHLKATLEDFKVPADIIAKALVVVESTRKDIVNTK
jgi:truncated hemoglobin YjbI